MDKECFIISILKQSSHLRNTNEVKMVIKPINLINRTHEKGRDQRERERETLNHQQFSLEQKKVKRTALLASERNIYHSLPIDFQRPGSYHICPSI